MTCFGALYGCAECCGTDGLKMCLVMTGYEILLIHLRKNNEYNKMMPLGDMSIAVQIRFVGF